jgi:hypothetical protein
MTLRPIIAAAAMLAAHAVAAQEHRFETDPVVRVCENSSPVTCSRDCSA